MTFIEAIKTRLPLTRKNKGWHYKLHYAHIYNAYSSPGTFFEPTCFLENVILTYDDIIAEDWVVKEDIAYETVE